MHRRTGDRHHQGGAGLPPVLAPWDPGCCWRVVPGLFGFQSQALPYLILGIIREGNQTFSSLHHLFCLDLPATTFRSAALVHAANNTPTNSAVCLIPTSFSPTGCYTFKQLYTEVNRVAAVLQSLGVGKGDRVLIYMPMIPEALF